MSRLYAVYDKIVSAVQTIPGLRLMAHAAGLIGLVLNLVSAAVNPLLNGNIIQAGASLVVASLTMIGGFNRYLIQAAAVELPSASGRVAGVTASWDMWTFIWLFIISALFVKRLLKATVIDNSTPPLNVAVAVFIFLTLGLMAGDAIIMSSTSPDDAYIINSTEVRKQYVIPSTWNGQMENGLVWPYAGMAAASTPALSTVKSGLKTVSNHPFIKSRVGGNVTSTLDKM